MLLCLCVLHWACARLAMSSAETSDTPQELLSDMKLCAEPSCSRYQKSQDTVEANYLSTVQLTMMEIDKVLVSTFDLMVQSVQPFTKQVIPWLEEYLPFSIEDSGSILKALLLGSLVLLILYFWKICVQFKMKCTLRKEKQLASTILTAIKRKTTLAEEIEICKRNLMEKHDVIEHLLKVQDRVKFSHHQQKEILDDLGLTMKRLQCELESKVEEREEMRDRCNKQHEMMMKIRTDIEEIVKESTGLQIELAKIEQKVSDPSGDCKTLQVSLIDITEKNGRYKAEVGQLGDRVVALTNHSEKLENQLRVEQEMSHCLNSSVACKEDERKVLAGYLIDLQAEITTDKTNGPTICTMHKAHKEENEQWRLKHATDERWIKTAIEVMEEQKLKSQEMLLQEKENKKNLEGRLDCLRKENAILTREKQHLEDERQEAQHRLDILAEMYKEKDLVLERKVVIEELAQKQNNESLIQYDEEIKAAQEKISKYKKLQQDLTEELLETERSFKHQIAECEKKIYETWLAERKTNRHLQKTRKEVDNLKQQLIRLHLKYEARHSILRPVPERPQYGHSRHPIGGSLCTSPCDLAIFDDDQGSNPEKFRPHSAGPLHLSP